jgi:hypothetical protein
MIVSWIIIVTSVGWRTMPACQLGESSQIGIAWAHTCLQGNPSATCQVSHPTLCLSSRPHTSDQMKVDLARCVKQEFVSSQLGLAKVPTVGRSAWPVDAPACPATTNTRCSTLPSRSPISTSMALINDATAEIEARDQCPSFVLI